MENSKTKLRSYAKNKRLDIKNKEIKEKIIISKLLNHEKIKNNKNILVYISMKYEVSTIELIDSLLKINKNIYAPKIVDKNLVFYKIDSLKYLKKSKHNILEPISNIEYIYSKDDVIIVPGLLFDKKNNRLGYGGGYYDRFLFNKDLYKIGICFRDFLVSKLITEQFDIKMNEVICD